MRRMCLDFAASGVLLVAFAGVATTRARAHSPNYRQEETPTKSTRQDDEHGPMSISANSDEPASDETEHSALGVSDSEALANKLANPVADLISIPLQSNYIIGGGRDLPQRQGPLRNLRHLPGPFGRQGERFLESRAGRIASRLLSLGKGDNRDQAFKYLLNVQPVIPFTLNEDWNLISRTILPIVAQNDVIGTTSQGGMGDITQSLFLSPKSTEPFIWGAGPVFLIPTATDDSLGSERWGMGPTGVILKQSGPWTVGALANHIWSFARDDGRKEVNNTYLQPFINYTFKTATSLTCNTESTYDWIDNQWTIPLYAGVGQIVKIGKLPVSLQLGSQYWVAGPETAPDWSIRFQLAFLFPKLAENSPHHK